MIIHRVGYNSNSNAVIPNNAEPVVRSIDLAASSEGPGAIISGFPIEPQAINGQAASFEITKIPFTLYVPRSVKTGARQGIRPKNQ